MFKTIRILRDPAASVEEKKAATTDYLYSSAELLAYKYLWLLYEYTEEVNFGAACILWAGYRGYRMFKGPAVTMPGAADMGGDNLFEKIAKGAA